MTATMSQVNLNTTTMTNAYNNGVGGGGGGGDGVADITNNANVAIPNTNMITTAATAQIQHQHMQGSISNSNNNCNHATHNNSSSNINNHQRAFSEHVKRKKLKSRSATMPADDGYIKDHLDAWLENCLKDATNTQLSSSSEFLDFNPNTNNANRNSFPMNTQQQQQHQQKQHTQHAQQQQQQQQQQQLPQQRQQRDHHHQQHQQLNYMQQQRPQKQQQQQQFAAATNATTTTNTANGYNMPFSQSFLRSMPNYMRPSGASASAAAASAFNNRFSLNFPSSSSAYFPQTDGSQDFASLPPIVNLLGGVGSAEHDNNSTDVLDGSASNPNISRGFRFSDPCLLNPSDNDSKASEPQTTSRNCNNLTQAELDNSLQQNNNNNNNKFFAALMEQINLLHETNSKIFRNLHETKVDIEALKHTPHWGGMRHRRDSLSGLSTHSQPMIFGGGLSTHSPASTYQSGAYAPGMMTDVVREVKEAARVREDALLNRVKALVEERQWSLNESNLRIMRDIEELKSQVHHLRLERKEANKRINHLETENKYMRQMLATLLNNQRQSQHDVLLESESLRARKPFPSARRSQSMNLHYGVVHEQQHSHLHHHHQQQQVQPLTTSSLSVEEETDEALHIIETPSTTSTTDVATLPIKAAQRAVITVAQTQDKRHSLSSSESSSGGASTGSAAGSESNGQSVINGNNKNQSGQIPSPPNFALISTPLNDDVPKDKVLAMADKKIQNELKEAVAARNEADKRIIALEKLVTNLRVQTNQALNIDGNGAATTTNTTATNNYGAGHTNNASASKAATATAIAAPKRSKQKTTQLNSANNVIKKNTTTKAQQHQHGTNVSNGFDKTYSPTHRLSVAGPITDL